jgi:hypothetical protein
LDAWGARDRQARPARQTASPTRFGVAQCTVPAAQNLSLLNIPLAPSSFRLDQSGTFAPHTSSRALEYYVKFFGSFDDRHHVVSKGLKKEKPSHYQAISVAEAI